MSAADDPAAAPVLKVRDLHVRLPKGSDRAYAVEAVNLTIGARETVCIVGESGSGKSVTASAVMGLLPPGVLTLERGQILLSGRDITHAPLQELRDLRGNRMAMVFQEPMTALNPVMRVGDQIAEAFEFHAPKMGRREVADKVLALLADVHLPSPETLRHSYPHQLSGGQRQRVMIAMALAMEPRLSSPTSRPPPSTSPRRRRFCACSMSCAAGMTRASSSSPTTSTSSPRSPTAWS